MTNRRAVLLGGAAVALAPFVARPAFAHREHRSETVIDFRDDGRVEVVHAFHLHDIESALSEAGVIQKADLFALRPRAKAALYVADHFALTADGRPVDLETLGAEIVGRRLEVYQESRVEKLPVNVVATAVMLRDIWSDQINSVDVRIGGLTRSARLMGNDREASLKFTS